jgi:hypothetical protein
MRGQPVWLASISRHSPLSNKKIMATVLWTRPVRDASAALLRRLVGPAGDATRERLFRMNVTMCLHRALTDEEVDSLPPSFHTDPPTDLAGGPVEVLWESEPGWPSTRPCQRPTRHLLNPREPLLWLPIDCGDCEPCRARAALVSA